MARAIRPALLSKDRLAFFRAQVARKNEAVFLAPQLLEQVSVLTTQVRAIDEELEALRTSVEAVELKLASVLAGSDGCPACNHEQLRAAVIELHRLAHEP